MKNDSFKSLLSLFPLLLVYIIVALFFTHNHLIGDELRHVHYALHLSEGFYSDPERPELLTGPGYPLFLVPFIIIGTSLLVPKLFNALLVFMAIVYFKKTLDLFNEHKSKMVFVYALGLYPPLIHWIPYLYSESLALFLICALTFHFCKLLHYKKLNTRHLIIASLF